MARNNLLKRSNYKGSKRDLKKEVQKYMKLPYTIKLIPEEDGTYYVAVDELPGCASMGDTVEEALEMIKDAMEGWLESNIERGLEIPLPNVMREYSGRFLVRVPVSLHRRLAEIAKKEGVSLNHYIVSSLSEKLSIKDIENELKIIKDKLDLLIATQNNRSIKDPEKNISAAEKILKLKWEKENGGKEQYIH
jgi:predicted RNase H-like HicB family nuclease